MPFCHTLSQKDIGDSIVETTLEHGRVQHHVAGDLDDYDVRETCQNMMNLSMFKSGLDKDIDDTSLTILRTLSSSTLRVRTASRSFIDRFTRDSTESESGHG